MISLTEIAKGLGLTTKQLDAELRQHAINEIHNEARRLTYREAFDAKNKNGADYQKPPELRHYIQAAKNVGIKHYATENGER